MCIAFLANLTSSTGNIDLTIQLLPACHHSASKCYLSDEEFWSLQKVKCTIHVMADEIFLWCYLCNDLLGKKTILDHILSWGINLKFKVLTIFYHSVIWQTKIKWKHKTNAHSRHLVCFGVCASSLPKYFLPLSGFEPWR